MFDFSGDFHIPGGGDKLNSWVQEQLNNKLCATIALHSLLKSPALSVVIVPKSLLQPRQDDPVLQNMKGTTVAIGNEITKLPLSGRKGCRISLCWRTICSYLIKEGSAPVTDDWILEHVVPRITAAYGATLAKVLGKALL